MKIPVYLKCLLLSSILMIISCAQSTSLLSTKGQNRQWHFSSQKECYNTLLDLTLQQLPLMSKKTFIRSLYDLARVQLDDTLPDAAFSAFEQYITKNIKKQEDKQIATFVNQLLAFKLGAATSIYSRMPPMTRNSPMLSEAVILYNYRNNNANTAQAKLRASHRSQEASILDEYWQRTLAFNALLYTMPTIQALLALSHVSPGELNAIFPSIAKNYSAEVYKYLLSRPHTYSFSAHQNLVLLEMVASSFDSQAIKDSLFSVFIESRNEVEDTLLNSILRSICENSLKKSAVKVAGLIKPNRNLIPDILVKYGWLVSDEDISLTGKAWDIAKLSFDTASFQYKSLTAYIGWLNGNEDSRTLLRQLIRAHPSEVTPRRMYLELALDAFDLKDLSAFLKNTEASIDSSSYNDFFLEYNRKVTAATEMAITVWQNAVGSKYYVYLDETGTEWLYDRNFLSLNTERFVNSNGNYRLWFSQNGSQYLYNDSGSYCNMYRYLNSSGAFVYASLQDGKTYYYNDSLKWTGFYSYRSKEEKKIYVKTVDEIEYYYDSSFNYLNTYAFTNTTGQRRYAVTDSFKTEFYDSTWQYLNKAKFQIPGYRDMYASCINSRLYFYYFDDNDRTVDLDFCLLKASNRELVVEETQGAFKYYFNKYGNYLGYYVWQNDGEIKAITINNYSECKTYFKGLTDISESCSGEKPTNIVLRYPFLSTTLFNLASSLISGTVSTPLDIFREIETQIAQRKAEEARIAEQRRKEEAWLAVANALNSFSETVNKSYSSYNSTKTYTPNYTNTYNTQTTTSGYSYSPLKNSLSSSTTASASTFRSPTFPSYNRYSYDNSPYNYENSPYNYNNSKYNYKNSEYNYKNSEYNYNNSVHNYKNSESNYENSPYNYKNSPYNYKNSYFNPSRTEIVDKDGNSVGYAVPKKGGGYNLFDNDGNRTGYSTGEGRGLFDTDGKNTGYIVPKKTGGANIFSNDE